MKKNTHLSMEEAIAQDNAKQQRKKPFGTFGWSGAVAVVVFLDNITNITQ